MKAVSRRKVISTLANGGASLALAGLLQNVNWDEVNRRVEEIGISK